MKKTIIIVLVSILILNGFGAVAFSKNSNLEKTEIIFFDNPIIKKQDNDVIFLFENSNSWINNPGYPLLPNYIKTYEFPFGTHINDIDIIFSEPIKYPLQNNLAIASKPLTQLDGENKLYQQTDILFKSDTFPESMYCYDIGMGLNNYHHVLILTIQINPVRYHFRENNISFSEYVNIKISYELPDNPINFNDEYDMVIIAPKLFSKNIQPLIEHKNSFGMNTTLKTTEDIYTEYDEGRDKQESIKLFIKEAIEEYGINYVLLVGGMKGQRYGWHLPVRYSHLDDNSDFESSFISDLYYSDIYDKEGNFSSWDTNENGIYAEWNKNAKDNLDLYPDVFLGRLPCRNNLEVKIIVNKIIKYENKAYGKEWFKKMVVVGGDSAPGYEYYEGEEENKKALEYMQDFQGIRVWTSNGNFTSESDVVKAITGGCGFLFFDGHGNPSTWSTHPPDNNTWITGLSLRDIPKLMNMQKLPVAVVGGCHNAQFNVTILNILTGILKDGFSYFQVEDPYGDFWKSEWVPECWAWHLVRKIGGGVISIMGYTGLDWFAEGDYNNDSIPDCIQYFSGFANTNFFKNYGVNNFTILGEAYTQTLNDYIKQFPIDWNMSWAEAIQSATILDCKTIEEFVLLGDPSLQIGGYEI